MDLTVRNGDFDHKLKQRFKIVLEENYQGHDSERFTISIQKQTSSVYSDVYLCRASLKEKAPIRLIAKYVKDDQFSIKNEFDILSDLWEKHYHQKKTLAIPEPIKYFEDPNIMFLKKVDGVPLANNLRKKAPFFLWRVFQPELEGCIKASANWLKTFHELTMKKDEVTIKTAIEEDLKLLGQFPSGAASTKLVRRCKNKLLSLADKAPNSLYHKTGRHGDYYDENIILSPGRTSVIDFAMFSYGLPLFDVVKFIVNLEIYSKFTYYNTHFFQSLIDLFLRQYYRANKVAKLSSDAVKLYKPILLLHELKWSEQSVKGVPTMNPVINYTTRILHKHVENELRAFLMS